MSKIAIIPARGGSKRIPRKNIKDFLGKPIIAYSIELALQSELFDEVMVSTDDEEIAKVAESYGASIPFLRSPKSSDDYATTFDVIKEVLKCYSEDSKGWKFGCCIYPTAPLIDKNDIQKGFSILEEGSFSTVFPVVPFDYPIWRGLRLEGNKVEMKWPEFQQSRSQDLEEIFHDAGMWYWFNCKELLSHGEMFSANSGYLKLNPLHAQDIDTIEDWSIAELKYKGRFNSNL
ncbi:pseudaminic acid cytidylyltransferase [Ekhidna sp.]